MTLRDSIYTAAIFLQLDEVAAAVKNELPDTELSDEVKKEIDLLVKCANLAIDEAASTELPLITTEEKFNTSGKIYLSELDKPPLRVERVTRHGVPVLYFIKRDVARYIDLYYTGPHEITYAYKPDAIGIDGVPPHGEALPERVLSYGIASEYCIINGMAEEAVTWNRRFYDGISYAARDKREKRMPKRKWL